MKRKLLLIRHGATPGNEEKRYIGRSDEALSELGREQILAKQDIVKDLLLQDEDMCVEAGSVEILQQGQDCFVVASPMKRCVETAELLGFDSDKLQLIDGFREIDFGDFEGKNYLELSKDPRYQAWIDSGGSDAFPQGEGQADFIQRVTEAFRQVVEGLLGKTASEPVCETTPDFGKAPLVCLVHGGTIMAILSTFAGGNYFDYQVKNGDGFVADLSYEQGMEGRVQISITDVRSF